MTTKAEREAEEVAARKVNNTRSALFIEANTLRSEGRAIVADMLSDFAKSARSDELARFREIICTA